MAKTIKDYLKTLGLAAIPSTEDELREAYWTAAKQAHPDANKDDGITDFTERMKAINEAREVLKTIIKEQEPTKDQIAIASIPGTEPIDELQESIREYAHIVSKNTYGTLEERRRIELEKLLKIAQKYQTVVKYTSSENIEGILEKLYRSINNAANNIDTYYSFQEQLMKLYEAVFLNFILDTKKFNLEIIKFLLEKISKIMNSEDYLLMTNNSTVTEFLLICYAGIIKKTKDDETSKHILDYLFQIINEIYCKVSNYISINSSYEECIEIGIYNIFMKLPNNRETKEYLKIKIVENQHNKSMINLLKNLMEARFNPPESEQPPIMPRSKK